MGAGNENEMVDQLPRLTSWKEIAVYLRSSVRTCQKYEARMALPVHRLDGSPKAHVFAYPEELDAWLADKVDERAKEPKPSPLTSRAVAVLPLVDLSPDGGSDHLASGISEAVIDVLCRIGDLRVSALASASAVRDRKLSLREVGKTLDVSHVLEGTVQVTGPNLRVTAQLVDVTNGTRLWANKYDRKLEDVFDIQNEISMAIVDELTAPLLSKERIFLSRRPTNDTEAYDLYLKGRFLIARFNPESEREALALFEAALDRDPTFALAYAGAALVLVILANVKLAPAVEAFSRAASAVRRALALDPDLAEAIVLDGAIKLLYEWNWEAAEKSFIRAIQLKPGDPIVRGFYSWLLLVLRRFEEARIETKRSLAADPLMPLNYYRTIDILGAGGYYEEALEVFSKCREIAPDFAMAYYMVGRVYRRLGRIDEAIEAVEKSRRLADFQGLFDGDLVACYVQKGDRLRAEALLAEMIETRKKAPVPSISLAYAHFALGYLDRGFDWLETAIRERAWEVSLLRVLTEYLLPDLAPHPRFQALFDRLGLPR